MAQGIKTLESQACFSGSGTHVKVEGEDRLQEVVLTPPHKAACGGTGT